MTLKTSKDLTNHYEAVQELVVNLHEPVYITHNGKIDCVLLNAEDYMYKEEMFLLRKEIIRAIRQKESGCKTYSASEIRDNLRK